MNKTAIKNFSIWARVKLREEMVTRAGFLGITENGIQEPLKASTREIQYFEIGADPGIEIFQREKLVRRLLNETEMIGYVRAYENMIETSASDWFNRLIAIRFMEINEYAPLETRLLSSAEEGKQDPDLYRIPLYQIWIFPIQNIIRLWNGRMRTGRRIKPHIRERTLFLGRIVFSLW